MGETIDDINNLKLQVGLLEKDIILADRQCEKVSVRVSDSIEKLQEINTNLLKMITIHEQKHEQHEKSEMELKDDIKELHLRITAVNREMHERMIHLEHSISEKIDGLRSDIITQNQSLPEKKNLTIADSLSSSLEKYKWMVIGAGVLLGWILGNFNVIIKFLEIFK
ncbi:hypothetical protein M0R04_05080 [Candidatus Dojkabacteria bacterium]|jgi:septal ring factor EnvC (AmiA/AmiB activator)|nr:hypothetical protein [Candidatus Dojkabacteria bacterium]